MRSKTKSRLKYSLFLVVSVYILVEVSASLLHRFGYLGGSETIWIVEDTGRGGVRFDPVSGFRHPAHPMRHAKITRGQVEYVGLYQGNNLGFPDRGDFWPERPNPTAFRAAVFGDSFSAGSFLTQNWVDAAELEAAAGGERIELLNFSLDGIGLANWWSIIVHLLDAEDYELDALVFAVYWGDLDRGFLVADHSVGARHHAAYIPYDDPARWPQSLDEARPYLERHPIHLLPTTRFFETLQGRHNPTLPTGISPYLLSRLLTPPPAEAAVSAPESGQRYTFTPAQEFYIKGIAEYAKRRQLPVLVMSVPDWRNKVDATGVPGNLVEFARSLNTEAIDGADAYKGLGEAELRAMWLPYDGHWDQPASDLYARFALGQILDLRDRMANTP